MCLSVCGGVCVCFFTTSALVLIVVFVAVACYCFCERPAVACVASALITTFTDAHIHSHMHMHVHAHMRSVSLCSLGLVLSLFCRPPNCVSTHTQTHLCCRPFVSACFYTHCVLNVYPYEMLLSLSLSLFAGISRMQESVLCSVSFSLFHSLAPTCRILLLDFTLFSYTFACFTHYASRHFSGSTSSRGLLLQPALLLRCRVNLRSCLRLLLLVLLFLCMSRIFAASRLLRLCGDRYHDVISHCAHKRDIHFLHVYVYLPVCVCVTLCYVSVCATLLPLHFF